MIDWSRATRAEIELISLALTALERSVRATEVRSRSAAVVNGAAVRRFEIERMRAEIDAR